MSKVIKAIIQFHGFVLLTAGVAFLFEKEAWLPVVQTYVPTATSTVLLAIAGLSLICAAYVLKSSSKM